MYKLKVTYKVTSNNVLVRLDSAKGNEDAFLIELDESTMHVFPGESCEISIPITIAIKSKTDL